MIDTVADLTVTDDWLTLTVAAVTQDLREQAAEALRSARTWDLSW